MEQLYRRRKVLAGLGSASTVGMIAGCLREMNEEPEQTPTETPSETPTSGSAKNPSQLNGYVRPDEDPNAARESLVCERREFDRHEPVYDEVTWGRDDDSRQKFAMRVDALSVEYGDQINIQLTNITDEPQGVPNWNIFNIEAYTEEGWQDVRGWSDGTPSEESLPYTEEVINQEPGGGYTWTFEMTEEGVLDGHQHEEKLTVCPELQSGRYRFVFANEIAVGFDVENANGFSFGSTSVTI